MIKFSAFSDEVTSDFRAQVAFLVSQNIPAMEIRFLNGKNIMELSQEELKETKSILHENKIEISAIGSPIGKVSLDKPFDIHLDKFKHAVELAHYFETSIIRVFSYYAPEGKRIEDYREIVIERLIKQSELLKETSIFMVHENEANIYGHSAENCVDLARSVNSRSFRLAYDPANFVWGENIPNNVDVCWPLMKSYVNHVHIKDWKLGNKITGSMPGEGDGQIKDLLKELVKENYNGYLTMEPHLKVGGQFGGETGPQLFAEAINKTKKICNDVGLRYE